MTSKAMDEAAVNRDACASHGGTVLVVNSGSSTLKYGLYRADGFRVWGGQFEGLQPGGTMRWVHDGLLCEPVPGVPGTRPFDAALGHLTEWLALQAVSLCAVAHRVVHGGPTHVAPCFIDDTVLRELSSLNALAPFHQPHNLAGVAAFRAVMPGTPQIACFDAAFHATLPHFERALPLPRSLTDEGLRRFGFHGLSYEHVVHTLRRIPGARVDDRAVLAHLGNGASLCATRRGQSVATTMGFSALDGLMMGTRSGSLDPGVVLHLWRQGWSLERVERMLYEESGLKGVSGLSADMRTLRASADPRAQEAIGLFAHRIRRETGALAAVLGGLDLIAFTGGIGEHDATLRAEIVESLGFLGVSIDLRKNACARGYAVQKIHAGDSAVQLWVVPADEGSVAARAALTLLGSLPPAPNLPACNGMTL